MIQYATPEAPEVTAPVTILEVAKKIVELADASPDFIYKRPASGFCTYVHRDEDGTPTGEGCIVGQALTQLGVEVPKNKEGRGAHVILQQAVLPQLAPMAAGDYELKHFISDAQMEQDAGKAWGAAAAPLRRLLVARGEVAA